MCIRDRYIQLIDTHKGLSKSESERLNSKLILMLMEKVNQEEFRDAFRLPFPKVRVFHKTGTT